MEKAERDCIYQQIIEFVAEYMVTSGYPPTVREIADGTGFRSTSSVYNHLSKMRDEKLINYVDGSPRTLTIPGCCYVRFNPVVEEAQEDGK